MLSQEGWLALNVSAALSLRKDYRLGCHPFLGRRVLKGRVEYPSNFLPAFGCHFSIVSKWDSLLHVANQNRIAELDSTRARQSLAVA